MLDRGQIGLGHASNGTFVGVFHRNKLMQKIDMFVVDDVAPTKERQRKESRELARVEERRAERKEGKRASTEAALEKEVTSEKKKPLSKGQKAMRARQKAQWMVPRQVALSSSF